MLTGTGSDGALGLRRIKERGGITIVQDPAEAEYDGMPRSALATGIVDLVLPIEEMPRRLAALLATHPDVPVEEAEFDADAYAERIFQDIVTHLRACTSQDFSGYKRSTVGRRVERRMQLRQIERVEHYLEVLRADAGEVKALADDLLVNVTAFFRDPTAFEKLAADVLPGLFEGRSPTDRVRVWSVGCATGEEPYSLTMLLLEEAARHRAPPQIQVFATDLHDPSLRVAREGRYPESIELDVSRERLDRFFHREREGYRIRSEVRDHIVFASHNVLKDPPFTRIDLIACRNLLIYLQRDVQNQVISVFHYALREGGYLMLGSAETLDRNELFRLESRRHFLHRRRNTVDTAPRISPFPIARARHRAVPAVAPRLDEELLSYGALHARIVEQYAPPSMLVGEDHGIVHLSGQAGRFLMHPGGSLTNNVFSLVREELRHELRSGLDAARTGGPWRSPPIAVPVDGTERYVVLRIRAGERPEDRGFFLVIFDEVGDVPGAAPAGASEEGGASAHEVGLRDARERLQAVIEEYEASQEEMRASNEELQSMNEELRSTMEELETSQEELQSINEELQPVNQENKHRVEELSQLSADLQNLLKSTDIATLFLDRNLRILRFTPRIRDFLSVRHTDRGRPLADLSHRLGYPTLVADVESVLERLVPVEREVNDEGGRCYLTRVLPYRSTDDRIEGVVLTFVDITDRKAAEDALRTSEERLRRMVNIRTIGVLTFDPGSGRLLSANESFLEMTGYTQSQVDSGELTWRTMTAPEDIEISLAQMERYAQTGRIGPYEKRYIRADGSISWMLFTGADLGDGTVVEYCIDITDAKAKEAELHAVQGRQTFLLANLQQQVEERTRIALEHEQRFRMLVEASAQIVWTADAHGVIDDSPSWRAFTGHPAGDPEHDGWPAEVHPDDRAHALRSWQAAAQNGRLFDVEVRMQHHSGDWRWMHVRALPLKGNDGAVGGWVGMCTDITPTVEALRQLRETRTRLTIAEQEERRRIAEILHNDLQQRLYGLQLKLGSLRPGPSRAVEPQRVAGIVDQSVDWIRQTIDIVRRLSVELNPPILQGETMEDLLVWLQAQMRELHGLRIELDIGDGISVPEPDTRILLFHAFRELLFNVVKHAGVDQAEVAVREQDDDLVVVVRDAGTGIPDAVAQQGGSGYGLFSIRDRLLLLGGDMQIESTPGRGTAITLRVPLHPGRNQPAGT